MKDFNLVLAFLQELDVDGDGKIDFVEFVTFIMESSGKIENSASFSEAVAVFDTDRDGLISSDDLRYRLNFITSL